MNHIIIAIDPGREKCGIAVVHKQTGVIIQQNTSTAGLKVVVQQFVTEYKTRTVVIGDGTSSREAQHSIGHVAMEDKPIEIIVIDEYRSTDEARRRYWQEHPPQGFRRFIPVTMQVPPRPVDDYVAVILAERYFSMGT